MANYIPLSGAADASGGYVLSPAQGEILTNGILQEAGAIAIAGDKQATSRRSETFPVWLGRPVAGPVGEGAKKPPTGAEFGTTSLAAKKYAGYLVFTDEMLEDLQNGDVNVLVDSGMRSALEDSIDANAIGLDSGTAITGVFDTELVNTTAGVELTDDADGLEKAISAALGQLEANGYGKPRDQAILLGFGFQQHIRDARGAVGSDVTTERLYGGGRDPFYGRQVEFSTNLNAANESGVGKTVGFVVHKPNIHVRIRKDIEVRTSTEATVSDGTTDRNAFEENLTIVRYETRLAFMVHDLNRSVVAIENTYAS